MSEKFSRPPRCALAELQQTFRSAILGPQGETPGFIIDAPTASAPDRFAVYREAYRLRLIEALAADYPALKTALGEEAFERLGRAYVDACPSAHFSIRWFGARLPCFLDETPAYDTQPALKELAAFEWALSEAFDAADSEALGREQLAALEPPMWAQLQLSFHPSLRRLELACNTPSRWQALHQGKPPPEIEIASHPRTWIVWRHDLKLLFRSLPAAEAFALQAFRDGCRFAEVCEALCERLDESEIAACAAGYLQRWLADGWLVGMNASR